MKNTRKILLAATLALFLSTSLYSQEFHTVQNKTLKEAIELISKKSNMPYIANSKLLDNKTAPNISNIKGAKKALEKILKDTNLEVSIDNETIVIKKKRIKKNNNSSSNSLGEVDILANSSIQTEGTGSYTMKESGTSSKFIMPPRETPQTIYTMSNQLINDFNLQNIADILYKTPGVTVSKADNDRITFNSRGGYSLNVQFNDMPSLNQIDGGTNTGPDGAIVDHVDVLLGASGLLNGAGEPGGTVNIVFKKPTIETKASASLEVGSWEKQRLVADVSGALTESGSVRARVVGVSQSEESYRDYIGKKKTVFYGTVEADISDNTTLDASISKQDIYDNVTDRTGLFLDDNGNSLNLPRSTFLSPSWTKWDKFSTTYSLGLEHHFSDFWKMKVNVTRGEYNADWLFAWGGYDAASGDIEYWPWAQETKYINEDIEAYVVGDFELFGREHQLVLGGNHTSIEEEYLYGDTPSSIVVNINDFDPKTSLPLPNINFNYSGVSKTKEYGIYSAGRFKMSDDLTMILGTRFSYYESSDSDSTEVINEDAVLSPYFGLVYDINDWSNAYASYSDIFIAQSDKNSSGKYLDPEVGSNYEIGVKGEFNDGKINASLALFKIEKTNEAIEDESIPYDPSNICGGSCYNTSGKTVTNGFDIGLSGELNPNWKMALGISQYKKDGFDTVRTLKVSSSYDLPKMGLTLGASIDSSSRAYGSWSMRQDARTLVDIFANYKFNKKVSLALNVSNLFDKTYYANDGSGYGNQYYGEPRNMSASLKFKF